MLPLLWLCVASAATTLLDMPPRYMWGWQPKVSGYCGSASVQMAGIFFGNWLTEDAIRGTSGGHNANHQLLIAYDKDLGVKGTSVADACRALAMNCSMWDYGSAPSPQHGAFVAWAAAAIGRGEPVIMGVYWGVESDDDYDHIVPMVGYDSDSSSSSSSSSVSAVYFHDLHTNASLRADLSTFVTTRQGCDSAARFGPGAFCLPKRTDYGLAVRGNQDARGVLLPTRLAMDAWTEPDYSREDAQHAPPALLGAMVTVSGLAAGARYALLRFEDPAAVPHEDFLNGAFSSKTEFVAAGETWSQRATFMSNSTTFFRSVRVPAAGRL